MVRSAVLVLHRRHSLAAGYRGAVIWIVVDEDVVPSERDCASRIEDATALAGLIVLSTRRRTALVRGSGIVSSVGIGLVSLAPGLMATLQLYQAWLSFAAP